MPPFPTPRLPALAAIALLALAAPARAADDDTTPKGPAVTVLKATKSCFAAIVELSGTIMPREETAVRPERPGLKVAEVLVDAGETVTAGQTLARLTLPECGNVNVQAPVAGTVSASAMFALGRTAQAADNLHFAVGPLQPTPGETKKVFDPFFKYLAEKLGVAFSF